MEYLIGFKNYISRFSVGHHNTLGYENEINKPLAELGENQIYKKSCQMKEFKAKMTKSHNYQNVDEHNISFGFKYKFVMPKGSDILRFDKPFKFVKEEYLVITGSSLVGNIGGTLGMFVGISFISTLEWIIDAAYKAKKWINSWRSEDQ